MSRSCAGWSFDTGSPPVFVRNMAGRAALRDGAVDSVGLLLIESGLDIGSACGGVALWLRVVFSRAEYGWVSACGAD